MASNTTSHMVDTSGVRCWHRFKRETQQTFVCERCHLVLTMTHEQTVAVQATPKKQEVVEEKNDDHF